MRHAGTAELWRSRPGPDDPPALAARSPRTAAAASGCGFASARAITSDIGRRADHASNLATLCRRHHRAVHEEGYQLDREPTARFGSPPDGGFCPKSRSYRGSAIQ